MSGESPIDSQFSDFSLDLSQGTHEEILAALSGAATQVFEELHFVNTEDDTLEHEDDILEQEDNMNMTEASSAITIQRAVFATPVMSPAGSQYGAPPPYSAPPLHHMKQSSPSFSACSSSTSKCHMISPTHSPPQEHSPVLSIASDSCVTQAMPHLSIQPTQGFLRTGIPCNMPMPGEYQFKLVLKDEKPVSKTAFFTYSSATSRVYIRQNVTVGLAFSFSCMPPPNALIRAMAIHKTPELVGEVLKCCPKHVEEQNKKGQQYTRHFIRGAANTQAKYCEDIISGRLSVTVAVSSLQQRSETTLQGFFLFPCFTSDFKKGPRHMVQLLFTLEVAGQVVGRCVVDTRVCASPGRDRDHDEARLAPVMSTTSGPVSSNSADISLVQTTADSGKKGMKRGASSMTQSLECSVPTKSFKSLSGKKVTYPIQTYPELIPFVNVCVQMMERVYQVQVQFAGGEVSPELIASTAEATIKSFAGGSQSNAESVDTVKAEKNGAIARGPPPDMESWLSQIGLLEHLELLKSRGIHSLSQIMSVTAKEFERFGIPPRHCLQLVEGKSLIQLANQRSSSVIDLPGQEELEEIDDDVIEDTQPMDEVGPSQSISQHSLRSPRFFSQLSGASNTSSQSSTFEVLRIQVKKTMNSGSSSSSSTSVRNSRPS